MQVRSPVLHAVLTCALILWTSLAATAQRDDYTVTVVEELPTTGLQGTVVDLDGTPIGGASLTYIGPGMRVRETVLTDSDGSFQLQNLEPGTHVITVSAKKYRPRHDLTLTVVAGAMSPTEIMLTKQPGFLASLLRAGFPQGWAAALLTMLLVARLGRSRWTSDGESDVRLGARPFVGAGAGVLVGIFVTLTAPKVFGLITESLPPPEHGSLAWAPQFAEWSINSIAALGAPLIGLVVSSAPGVALRPRRSVIVAGCGGVATGVTVFLSPTASGLGALRNNLRFVDLPGVARTESLYIAMVVVCSGLMGMLVGLCVSYAVSFLRNRRPTSGIAAAPPAA